MNDPELGDDTCLHDFWSLAPDDIQALADLVRGQPAEPRDSNLGQLDDDAGRL